MCVCVEGVGGMYVCVFNEQMFKNKVSIFKIEIDWKTTSRKIQRRQRNKWTCVLL